MTSPVIPIQNLAKILVEDVCNTILKINVLKGCDTTSKVRTKEVALKDI